MGNRNEPPLLANEEHRRSGLAVAIAVMLALVIGVAAALLAGSWAFRTLPLSN